MSSNVFMNNQLERIADYIDAGKAGGGSLTVDVTGAGDMQGATAGTAGVHGLVPAPAAGDQDKVLTGAGTWVTPASGGVNYDLAEQNTKIKWIDGKDVYQRSFSFSAAINPNDWVQIGTISGIDQPIKADICTAYSGDNWVFGNDYVKCMVDGSGNVYYYAEQMGVGTATFYLTVWYTKV